MDTSEIWTDYIEVSGGLDTHARTCEVCADGHWDEDIWRIETDCTWASTILDRLKAIEVVLGITPTNR